ncbi:hypothetical protein SMD44_08299 [Streptomyces alboflavus]|uniref:Uncharacterized protein n=1 Tax=Streptomyces alboflavus TaxID=67267 RepID=A0A1Z1WR72_9ACTN|nr:hypothetical protein SMD44_08299 [Streptomyces alboflavus]
MHAPVQDKMVIGDFQERRAAQQLWVDGPLGVLLHPFPGRRLRVGPGAHVDDVERGGIGSQELVISAFFAACRDNHETQCLGLALDLFMCQHHQFRSNAPADVEIVANTVDRVGKIFRLSHPCAQLRSKER